MKKAFFILVALAILIPSQNKAGASESQLLHEEGSEVTFDSRTGRYWYYDLARFTHMTYDEQIAEIETISVKGFTDKWHMATFAEMAGLWSHSAEALFSSFALTMDDETVQQFYTLGRYDEKRDEARHYFAYVGLASDGQTYEKTALNYLSSIEDTMQSGVLGAWVVYEEESTHIPSVGKTMVPAIMLLLSDSDTRIGNRFLRSPE